MCVLRSRSLLIAPVRRALLHERSDAFHRIRRGEQFAQIESFDRFERVRKAKIGAGEQRMLSQTPRRRAEIPELAEQLRKLTRKVLVRRNIGDKSEMCGLVRRERFTGEHQPCGTPIADALRQERGGDRRQHTELDLWQTEARG